MKQNTVKTSKRFLSFFIDVLLISIVIQLLLLIFKTPIENIFGLEKLSNEYYQIGQAMGVFDASNNAIPNVSQATIDAFYANERVQTITSEFRTNQMIVGMCGAFISASIFLFIIPAILGDGRTIGKLLTKLKVVKKDGSKINFMTIFLRGFVGLTLIEYVISIPLAFLPFMISAMLVFVSNNKRALHDYIAGTTVTYVEGFEPVVKEKEDYKVDPYHKKAKGFEYIDVEAIERKQKLEQEKEDKQEEVIQEEVVQPRKASDITMDEIEMKEKLALERMKAKKEQQDKE